MSVSSGSRQAQVTIGALFFALAALACVYIAILARPTTPTLHAVRRLSRPLQSEAPSPHARLVKEKQCVPPDWPAGVVHPDIFIVGHSKTGSTYIHALLTQHPDIIEASQKEINFFPPKEPTNATSKYASYFPKRSRSSDNAVSIDASISYVTQPGARDTLYSMFPCAKIIFLMRDPTVRWWSGYNHVQRRCTAALKRGEECTLFSLEEHYAREMNMSSKSFAEVGFTKEVQESGVSFFSLQRQKLPLDSILSQTLTTGMYYSRVMEWLEVWPMSQILLVNTEEYFDPVTLNDRMRIITEFAGLKSHKFAAIPPKLPARSSHHKAPGDYGPLPEPYYSGIRAFYEPDMQLLKKHFGVTFSGIAGDDAG